MKEHWQYKKLIDVCDIQYGYPFESSLFSSSSEDGMPLIRIRDVKNGYSETFYKGSYPLEYIVSRGDYLIGMDGEFNISAWKSEDALLNQRVCKISAKNSNICIKFIYRFLSKELKSIEDETPFVTVKHLSAKRINQIFINIPPIEEQERIVKELDLLSGIIEKQKQQLKELDTLAQSIFYSMFGDPISNDKNWEVKKLYEVAPQQTYKGEIQRFNEKFWLLNLDKVESNTGRILSYDFYNEKEIGNSTIKFDETNILYSKLRPYLNKVVIPKNQGFATSELIPLKPNPEILDRIFIAYLLRSNSFVNYISEKVAGAKMPRVSMDELRNFLVILPPLSLQNEFAEKIEKIEKQKEAINKSIEETQNLFDYTMDKYFG